MNWYVITMRSVTFAQRGEQALLGAHFRCYIARTPKWMAERGCGYCIHVQCQNAADALQILARNGLRWQKVYRDSGGGMTEVVP